MEEKLSDQVRRRPHRRGVADQIEADNGADKQEHTYKSRTYKSVVNEVCSNTGNHSDYQNKKRDDMRHIPDRVQSRDYSKVYRGKEISDKSNNGY